MISYLELEPLNEIQDRLHCNRRLEVLHQFLRLFIPKQERGADILHLCPINSHSNILILISLNRNSETIANNLYSPSALVRLPPHQSMPNILFNEKSSLSRQTICILLGFFNFLGLKRYDETIISKSSCLVRSLSNLVILDPRMGT